MTKQLSPPEVEALFEILQVSFPKPEINATGPKGQPDPFQSCVSCLLSAQSRDENTAKAARSLFALAATPQAILTLDEPTIAAAIKPCGLYNVKARNLKKLARAVIDDHDGVIPQTRAGLMSLPGIGRKCADIVMSFTFGIDTIAVDTHIHRVCNRTGLARGNTGDQTARDLDDRAPAWSKTDGHFWLLNFGKQICRARAPKCPQCPIAKLCQWPEKRCI